MFDLNTFHPSYDHYYYFFFVFVCGVFFSLVILLLINSYCVLSLQINQTWWKRLVKSEFNVFIFMFCFFFRAEKHVLWKVLTFQTPCVIWSVCYVWRYHFSEKKFDEISSAVDFFAKSFAVDLFFDLELIDWPKGKCAYFPGMNRMSTRVKMMWFGRWCSEENNLACMVHASLPSQRRQWWWWWWRMEKCGCCYVDYAARGEHKMSSIRHTHTYIYAQWLPHKLLDSIHIFVLFKCHMKWTTS